MESVRWLIAIAWQAGVERIILNGSFVTDVLEPNDVDCVLLIGKEYPKDRAADKELENGQPYIQHTMVGRIGFAWYTERLYASDRDLVRKGMIEVIP